jgi:hypothetical protein
MRIRLLIWILWPAFLVACLGEGLLFTLIDPEELIFFGHHLEMSKEGVYTLGFFMLWALCGLSSLLTIYILPGSLDKLKGGQTIVD